MQNTLNLYCTNNESARSNVLFFLFQRKTYTIISTETFQEARTVHETYEW